MKTKVLLGDSYLSSFHIDVPPAVPGKEGIEDHTETNLVNLRRVIYLTIMDAFNYEEAVHKLLEVQLKEGEEVLFRCLLVLSVAYMAF